MSPKAVQFFPHLSPVSSTLPTLAIKACAIVNNCSLAQSYFYFYNIKVFAKVPGNFPQHHRFSPVFPYVNPLI